MTSLQLHYLFYVFSIKSTEPFIQQFTSDIRSQWWLKIVVYYIVFLFLRTTTYYIWQWTNRWCVLQNVLCNFNKLLSDISTRCAGNLLLPPCMSCLALMSIRSLFISSLFSSSSLVRKLWCTKSNSLESLPCCNQKTTCPSSVQSVHVNKQFTK